MEKKRIRIVVINSTKKIRIEKRFKNKERKKKNGAHADNNVAINRKAMEQGTVLVAKTKVKKSVRIKSNRRVSVFVSLVVVVIV